MQRCNDFIFTHENIMTRVSAIDKGIFRITRTLRKKFLNNTSAAVTLHNSIHGELFSSENENEFSAGQIAVRVNSTTGAMTFLDDKGGTLLREPVRRPCQMQEKPVCLNRFDPHEEILEELSVDGTRASAKPTETYQDRIAYECRQHFLFDEVEGLYGLGSHEEGWGNLRGHSQELYQHNLKAVVPVLVSTKGWGVLFDMGCMMTFHDDSSGSYFWVDCADELEWYIFYGDGSYASLMQQYRSLTGATPMLPKYALGYIQSKERYVNAKELLEVASEYRDRNIPLDMLVLDWMSWPDGEWGWKCFDETRFPDPAQLIHSLHHMKVKFMISIWPSMQGEHNENRAEMLEKGYMLGNRLVYDAFSADARKLYWKQTNDQLFCHGVDAWWCDCSEPFEGDWHGSMKPEPYIRVLINTEEAKRYLDPVSICLYSIHHAQAIYYGQRGETEEKRVCNLTRSSWAGQHRYGTITWSGDVSATWETLRRHVPEGLNFCATGEAFWSADIGAFFPAEGEQWFIDGDFDKGVDDLGYREFYVRWAQYAAFLPMMRSHGTGTPREIWRFGDKGSMFYDAIEAAIRLRYHLIPYLYSLMALTYTQGVPMLRVPALAFPADEKLRQLDDQMMLGDALLVKPVTFPMYYLSGSRKIDAEMKMVPVYLPEGHRWYNLYTGAAFDGGQTINMSAPLNQIPVLVRSGSILPWGGKVQSTSELKDTPLEIIIYPGEDGSLTLYDDSGDGYGYETAQYATISFHWDDQLHVLTINNRQGTYEGMPKQLYIKVKLACNKYELEVVYTGEKMSINDLIP